ncbi:MAG: SRPBCC family protein [Candidatus Limnocylindria bacterium]
MVVVVNRPVDDVWAFLTDWFNAPRDGSMLMVRQTSPGPTGVGSTLLGRRVILGVETRFDLVITEWDPPHVCEVSGTSRLVPSLLTRFQLEPVPTGTRMVVSSDVELATLLKPIWPLYAPFFSRQLRTVFRNFKQLVESQPGRAEAG